MGLCGSSFCGCAVTSVPADFAEIDGAFPTINVAGNGTGASPWNLTLDDEWAGAVVEQIVTPCTSATRPAGVEGRLIFETDTDDLLVYDGAAWVPIASSGGVASWTPTLTATTTNPTLGTGSSVSGRLFRQGSMVTVWARIQFGTSGVAAGSGVYIINLPVAASTLMPSSSNGSGQSIGSGHFRDNGSPVEQCANCRAVEEREFGAVHHG